MENSASSGTGSSPPRSVFCSSSEIRAGSEHRPMSGAGKQHVENVLGEYPQKRLNETTELCEQQKMELRLMIADLQTKLVEVQLERDALRNARQKEAQSQENVKIQLKSTIQELEAANQLQEEMLREADSQTEHLKKMLRSHKDVLLELQGILLGYEDSTGKNLCERENVASLPIYNLSAALAGILQDFDSELSYLREKVVLMGEELESLKKDSQTQKELLLQQRQNSGIEQLRSEHEQEVAALTDSASSAGSSADSARSQTQSGGEETGHQSSVPAQQVGHLESAVSQLHLELREAKRMCEDKVKALDTQLHGAHSEISGAQTEQEQHSHESGNLKDQVHQLLTELRKKEIELSLEKEQNKQFWDQTTDNSITIAHLRRELDTKAAQLQRMENAVKETRAECHRHMEHQMAAIKEKNESIGRISSLTVQLELTKETLCKVKEDVAAKQVDLQAAEKTVSNLTSRLQEKERAREVTDKEMEELQSQLGRRVEELQHLKDEEDRLHSVQTECKVLKQRVLEKERVIEVFQKEMDTMARLMGQHSRTAGAAGAEKSRLVRERNGWKLKVQELKIAKDAKEARIREMEARLSELELEKVKLVHTGTERLHALNAVKLEKEQLRKELQASRSTVAGLAERFEDVKRDYRDKIEEMENTASRLKMQLKSAQAELEQTRTALKALQGSDGNALEAAVGMQKKITAMREHIDALQSQVKFLEEAMTSAAKEKHCLREENSKLSQELSCLTAENTRIAGELQILRSQAKRLREKVSKMETALDKASLQFAECQCIIQCQEQDAMRFRLRHTLDVKELQGPGYSSASASGKLRHGVPFPHWHSAVRLPPPSLAGCAHDAPSKPGILKQEPLEDLKNIPHKLRSSDSDIPAVDPGKGDSSAGEKTPSATVRNTVYEKAAARDSASESIVEKDTSRRDPSCLHMAELQFQDVTLPLTSLGGASVFSAPRHTCSPRKVSQEERCREKSPVHMLLTAPSHDLATGPSTSPEHRLSPRKVGSPEGAATAPQITTSPMVRTQDTKTESKAKEAVKVKRL